MIRARRRRASGLRRPLRGPARRCPRSRRRSASSSSSRTSSCRVAGDGATLDRARRGRRAAHARRRRHAAARRAPPRRPRRARSSASTSGASASSPAAPATSSRTALRDSRAATIVAEPRMTLDARVARRRGRRAAALARAQRRRAAQGRLRARRAPSRVEVDGEPIGHLRRRRRRRCRRRPARRRTASRPAARSSCRRSRSIVAHAGLARTRSRIRPLVLAADAEVTRARDDDGPDELLVTVDGQVGTTFGAGETLVVRRAAAPVPIVRFPEHELLLDACARSSAGAACADRDETDADADRAAHPELRDHRIADAAARAGFNVLSGETGAGKSIIVGALGLLLGERASADLIRTGADAHGRRRVRRRGPARDRRRCSTSAASTPRTSFVVLKREIVGRRARARVGQRHHRHAPACSPRSAGCS